MRTDKDRSGVALWVIPVCLAVVSFAFLDHRLRDICRIPLHAADCRSGRRRSHCEAADVAL